MSSKFVCQLVVCSVFFQAEDGIRDLVRSRGLGDVYKRQPLQRGYKNEQRFVVSFFVQNYLFLKTRAVE